MTSYFNNRTEHHIERIECPECGTRQIATILHTSPFWTWLHHCISCNHTITESEWICIDTEGNEYNDEF